MLTELHYRRGADGFISMPNGNFSQLVAIDTMPQYIDLYGSGAYYIDLQGSIEAMRKASTENKFNDAEKLHEMHESIDF